MKYCKSGHEQIEENTCIVNSRGRKYCRCRLCRNEKYVERSKKYRKKNPWYTSFSGSRARCNYPYAPGYERYGGKGIKFLMTLKDFEFMWHRDKAFLMKRPSIDRIDNKGNYELSNCQFMELSENSGKDKIGEKHRRTKLKDQEVREIRNLYFNKKISEKEIIKKFKTSHGAVYSILKHRTWKHVKEAS